jgi:acetylornithine deacetylase/succinyl-diaminopimelate desuccinylase-like protein
VRDGRLYARGACDDKGQTYLQIKAVEGLLKTTGKLPVNVKFLIEGEEEVGGEHIEAYVKSKPPRLQADELQIEQTRLADDISTGVVLIGYPTLIISLLICAAPL